MKIRRTVQIVTLSLCAILITSCAPTAVVVAPKQAPKQAPPGQVKKATGAKSAKAYAPGQQKKKQR